MINLINVKKITLALSILVVIFVIILIFVLNSEKGKPTVQPGPGPAKSDKYNVSTDQKILNEQGAAVSALILKTPYKGNGFSLDFNFTTGRFILILNSNNLVGANSEFDNFLKQNGVQSRTWFTNLDVYTKAPTPAP
jgi:hypothetical protein